MNDVFKPEDFEDCKTFNLNSHSVTVEHSSSHVAAKANRILRERGQRVYGYLGPSAREGGTWMTEVYKDADSTHTALLLCVEPIVRDTHESLLAEIIKDAIEYDRAIPAQFIDRFRALKARP